MNLITRGFQIKMTGGRLVQRDEKVAVIMRRNYGIAVRRSSTVTGMNTTRPTVSRHPSDFTARFVWYTVLSYSFGGMIGPPRVEHALFEVSLASFWHTYCVTMFSPQQYMKVLSRPLVYSNNHPISWTPIYLDWLVSARQVLLCMLPKPCMLCRITDLYECYQSPPCPLWRT